MVADARGEHGLGADERRNGLQGHRHAGQRSAGETLECFVSERDERREKERERRRSPLPRGPGHHLLEHPDKDGNMPLMHACAKMDIG